MLIFRLLTLAILFLFIPQNSSFKEHVRYYPHIQLKELFEAVQLQHIYPDSKTFVDCVPMSDPEAILAEYRVERKKEGFNLNLFVNQHFVLPEVAGKSFNLDLKLSMQDHIQNHWSYLTREADDTAEYSSLLPLPYAYVVPGGRFREIYYWDSYFTMHGLEASGRTDLVESMLKNFAFLINEYGFIPNGNRTYYLSRSQPPFFAGMIGILQHEKGTQEALQYLPPLEKEYNFWMNGKDKLNKNKKSYRRVVQMQDGSILNRYYDDLPEPRPESYLEDVRVAELSKEINKNLLFTNIRAAAESGWDFSSRWLADNHNLETIETINVIPVDLNSLLYNMENMLSDLYFAKGDKKKAEKYDKLAEKRKNAINKWLWDEKRKFYADYNLRTQTYGKSLTLAAVYPLYFNIAPEDKVKEVAKRIEKDFLKSGGLVTSLVETGQQWDYPNGWAPLQWLAIKGLENYEHTQLSDEITKRWLALNRKVFQETGKMMEKYNVVDTTLAGGGGEYPLQDGFGWTNGVAISLINNE